MLTVRRAHERGHADHGWLDTYHTFSFADYFDPAHMGFRTLRVINEDWVKPGMGFGTHPHRDMEIVTYVLEGALQHKDSMGTGSVIRPYEVQRMSAGTGVTHSEFNHSRDEPVHLLQIWILPERRGIVPSYEQASIDRNALEGRWQLIAGPEGAGGAVRIHQDAQLWAARPTAPLTFEFAPGRFGWLQVARGKVSLAGHELVAGDGVAIANEKAIEVAGSDGAEVLLFDLA